MSFTDQPIYPKELWRVLAHVMVGMLTVTFGWINVWMYSNYCYNYFVSCP